MHWSSSIVSLCALFQLYQCCWSFVVAPSLSIHRAGPGARISTKTAPSEASKVDSRLHATILLIVEENEDDDENEQEKKNGGLGNGDLMSFGEVNIAEGASAPPREEIRLSLSDLLVGGGASSMPSLPIQEWKEQLARNPPPLTAVARARLEKEITLLGKLANGNEAVVALSNLWVNARGPGPAKTLSIANALMNQGNVIAWTQAEQVLRKLIEEEGIYWAEPMVHLANLKYMQGRMEESKELSELVLSHKPWHLGALQVVHKACRALDDHKSLVKWDRDQMPSLEESPRGKMESRATWAKRMVEKATSSLQRAEQGLQSFFHDIEESEVLASEGIVFTENGHSDAWQ